MKIYNKKNITLKPLYENKKTIMIEKKNLILKETGEQDAYVEPQQQGQSLSSALSQERANDPNANTFVASASDFDNNQATNKVMLDINAKNPADAQSQVQQKVNNNPQLKSLKPMLNIHMENIKKNSVMFTKNELDKILMG